MPATVRVIDILKHAAYLSWCTRAVALANAGWRARRPGRDDGDELMTRDGLTNWLYRWAIDSGRVADPGPARPQPESAYVALVFDDDRKATLREARDYWRRRVAGRTGGDDER